VTITINSRQIKLRKCTIQAEVITETLKNVSLQVPFVNVISSGIFETVFLATYFSGWLNY